MESELCGKSESLGEDTSRAILDCHPHAVWQMKTGLKIELGAMYQMVGGRNKGRGIKTTFLKP